MRLNRFDYEICHVPGKILCTANTYFRAPIAEPGSNSVASQNELEIFMEAVTSSLPTSHNRLQEYCDKQKQTPCIPEYGITAQVDGQISHKFPQISNHMQRYAVS